jgi:hypothetical protein
MSGIIALSAAASVAMAAAMVVDTTLPGAQALLLPLTDGGNEYAVAALSIVATVSTLAIMTVLVASGQE